MRYVGSYAVVLALHLLTVAFVVGPLAVIAVTSARLVRTGDLEGLRSAVRTTRVYAAATLVTVLLGSALVGLSGTGTPTWDMGDGWILGSYLLWLVAVVLTVAVVLPGQRAALAVLESGGTAVTGRIAVGAGLAMLCWTAIVVLMVFKPGA